MKVVCKGYKTCEYKHKCYHSRSHDILTEVLNKPNFFECVNKCELNNKTNCNCSAIYLRKEKLEKLYEENNK